jgi:hypothetical protein
LLPPPSGTTYVTRNYFSDLKLMNWLKSTGTKFYTNHRITDFSAPLNWSGPKLKGSISQNGFGMEALNRYGRNYWNKFVMSMSANYKVKHWSIT